MGEEERRRKITVVREKAIKRKTIDRERVIEREKDRDRNKHTETDINRQAWTAQSRCYIRQFFLRQFFWFSSTIQE